MQKLTPEYPAEALAEALEGSESGFAAHRRKAERPRRRQDAELRPLIAQSFAASRRTYGCLRVRPDLQDRGQCCGKDRTARLMRLEGLRPRQKRRFRPRTTDSGHAHPGAENWLAKVPAPDRPGLVWQSDFTYLETAEGWLFPACTLDACTRRCVAHHCRPDLRGKLTTTTLALALRRQPPPPGLLHRQRSWRPIRRRRLPGSRRNPRPHPPHEPHRQSRRQRPGREVAGRLRARPPRLPFGLPAAGCLAPLGSSPPSKPNASATPSRPPAPPPPQQPRLPLTSRLRETNDPPKQRPLTSSTYQQSKPRFRGKIRRGRAVRRRGGFRRGFRRRARGLGGRRGSGCGRSRSSRRLRRGPGGSM